MTAENKSGRWAILGGIWLIYFFFGVVVASMAPLITPITTELGIGNAAMGGILGAWPFVYILAAIPCGILLDRLGARRVLLLSTLIMAASSYARSMAGGPWELLAAVALFGLGGPMISVGAPKVIAGLFTGPTRATAMGIYVTGPYLGGLLSLALTNSVVLPFLGGDWRDVLSLYALLVASSGVLWLAVTSVFRSVLAEGEGGKKFQMTVFAELVRLPEVRLILWMSIGIFFINHGLNNWLPEILMSRGVSSVDAGFWAAVPSAVGVVSAVVVPRLAVPRFRLLVMASLFVGTLSASLLLHLQPGLLLGVGLFLQGIARGAMMTVCILLLMETPRVPQDRLGLAGGLFFTAAEIGGVFGPLTFGVLSSISGGFTVPLLAMTCVCCCLLWLLFRLKEQARSPWGDG